MTSRSFGLSITGALICACGATTNTAGSDAGVDAGTEVKVGFDVKVNGAAFSCTTLYTGVGSNPDAGLRLFQPKDARFYVHDVRLTTASGEVPVTLADDGRWQDGTVALIDAEDGTGTCLNGNAPTNLQVVGTAPAGSYVGLKFKVGVPFAKNHLLADNQVSPLNLSAMFWSWTGGYRFARIEAVDAAGVQLPGGLLHLGSTGCTPTDSTDPRKGVTACTNENLVEVVLPAFDVATDRVLLDLGKLFEHTDLAVNTANTSTGCMSAQSDPECQPLFLKLGLPFGAAAASDQTAFTRE
jgi:uncharacterized repeat protein (TIGR04052 family)